MGKLAIPERGTILPRGYHEQVRQAMPSIKDFELLDEYHGRFLALTKYLLDKAQRHEAEASARWVEVRIGELLGDGKEGRPKKTTPASVVSEDDRYKFRVLATHQDVVATAIANGQPSRRAILQAIEDLEPARDLNAPQPDLDIRIGDFSNVLADIAVDSVPLILTDPPYAAEFLPEYDKLGAFAAKVLEPGGSLITYAGPGTLPDVLDALRPHLRYWWTLALTHQHGGQQLPGKWVLCSWKPLLWFVREHRAGRTYVADRIEGTRPRKSLHPWAQGLEEIGYLIQQLTAPGELVVDPFAGSGTTGLAARSLGRTFLGADCR